MAISLVSNIVLYFLAVQTNVDQSNYYAFTAAYGSVMGAFSSLAGIALSVGRTGCGKSTLMRILLGFEKPERELFTMTARTLPGLISQRSEERSVL